MSAIDFIASDIDKAGRRSGWIALWSAALFLLPPALGVGLRRDTVGLFDVNVVASSTLMAIVAAAIPWLLSTTRLRAKTRRLAALAALAAVVAWSCWRSGFPWGTTYATWDEFWHETGLCFGKGLLTGLVMSALSAGCVHRFLPVPPRGTRVFLAALGGLCGIVMLNLHCPSSHVGHLAAGHWLQAVLIWAASYVLLTWLFNIQMRAALGTSSRSVDRLARLGD